MWGSQAPGSAAPPAKGPLSKLLEREDFLGPPLKRLSNSSTTSMNELGLRPSAPDGMRKTASMSGVAGAGGGEALPKPMFDGARKKSTVVGMRKWVKYDKNGETTIIQADKHSLTHRLGVQLRDLRLLDPQLATSYPSAILARDKALVVNLEHIRCIITVDRVLVLNADDENVIAFIEELQRRLAPAQAAGRLMQATGSVPDLTAPGVRGLQPGDLELPAAEESPFELRALEVVLDVVCSSLERLTADLEAAAHPALDALTTQVSTLNLERVRRIKNRMVRLTTRVETIREVLEKFLDDDSDMKDMNLTAKQEEEMQRQASHNAAAADAALAEEEADGPPAENGGPATPFGAGQHFGHGGNRHRHPLYRPSLTPGGANYAESSDSDDESEVAEVEMLLEAYFMQVDNTYNKLQTLCEYIDDTEDYINIELDSHRNQLIRLELLLSAATFAITIVGVISGLFGMNLNNRNQESYSVFVIVSSVASGGAVLVFLLILAFAYYKKMLSF